MMPKESRAKCAKNFTCQFRSVYAHAVFEVVKELRSFILTRHYHQNYILDGTERFLTFFWCFKSTLIIDGAHEIALMFTVQFRRENFTKLTTWKLWKFLRCFSWQSVIFLWFVDLIFSISCSSTHNIHTCIQTAMMMIDHVNITNINKKISDIEFAYLNTKDGTIVNLTLIFFVPVETMTVSLSLRRADGEVKPGVYNTNLYTKPLFRHQMEISELVDGKKGNFLTTTVGGAILKMSDPPIQFPLPAGAYKFINVAIPSPIQFKLFYYNNMKYHSTLKDNPNKKVMTSEWHIFGRNFWRSSLMFRQSSHTINRQFETFISSNYKDKQHNIFRQRENELFPLTSPTSPFASIADRHRSLCTCHRLIFHISNSSIALTLTYELSTAHSNRHNS